MFLILLVLFIHADTTYANLCLDSMNLKSKKWQDTKYKLNHLKMASTCFKDFDRCTQKKFAEESPQEIKLPAVPLSTKLMNLGKDVAKQVRYQGPMTVAMMFLDPEEISCTADNQSRFAHYYEGCKKPTGPYTDQYGFLDRTKKFLDLSEEQQARELLTHPEFCEVILESHQTIYSEATLQCEQRQLTLTDTKSNSIKRLRWSDDGEIMSFEDSHRFDPLRAYKIEFLGGQSTDLFYVSPKELTLGNRSRRANFDEIGSQKIKFAKFDRLPPIEKERLAHVANLFARWNDILNMKSCCQKKPVDPRRCEEVLPKAARSTPDNNKSDKIR